MRPASTLAAVALAGSTLLAACSGASPATSSESGSVAACAVVQHQWASYFQAAGVLVAAGQSATPRQKADFTAVRLGVLADLNRIAAAGTSDVNVGAGLIAQSLQEADQSVARDSMTAGTAAVKKECGFTLQVE